MNTSQNPSQTLIDAINELGREYVLQTIADHARVEADSIWDDPARIDDASMNQIQKLRAFAFLVESLLKTDAKVYIAEGKVDYEPGYVYGAFTTKENAEKAFDFAEGYGDHEVREIELDRVYPDGINFLPVVGPGLVDRSISLRST